MPTNLLNDSPMMERTERSRRVFGPTVALIAFLAALLLAVGTLRLAPSSIGDAATLESADALIGP